MIRIAVLDDYQGVALQLADWSPLTTQAQVHVYNDHLSELPQVVQRLLPDGPARSDGQTLPADWADEFDLKYRRVDGYSIKARLKEARERAGTAGPG